MSLFDSQLTALLARAIDALARYARTSDATRAEIDEAIEAQVEAHEAVAAAVALFDLVTAERAGAGSLPERFHEETFLRMAAAQEVRETVEALQPVHFPAAFPEVFLRDNPGFDCLLGNPPWEKVVVDREVWWGGHLPGVRSLPVSERRARIDALEAARPDLAAEFESEKERAEKLKLHIRATFPKLGTGQTDLYKAFAWANLGQAREGGRVGIILPRSAISDAGMTNWRNELIFGSVENLSSQVEPSRAEPSRAEPSRAEPSRAEPPPGHCRYADQSQGLGLRGRSQVLHGGPAGDHALLSVVTCLNTRRWVFDDVDPRYTVALISAHRRSRHPAAPRGWP